LKIGPLLNLSLFQTVIISIERKV